MKHPLFLLMAATVAAAAPVERRSDDATSILIESFSDPVHTWEQMNDPVMGGRSTGSFHVEDHVGVFEGEVVNVPFLHAPGFIQARTVDRVAFPDVSRCTGLQLTVRTTATLEEDAAAAPYTGYRFSFGNAHAPGGKWHAYGFKTDLKAAWLSTDEFTDIVLPFSSFTDFWDDATGDPIHTCEENPLYCPDAATLQNMKTMAIWAEGVAGRVYLELKEIRAVGCYADTEEEDEEQQQQSASVEEDNKRHIRHGSISTHVWDRFGGN